MISKETFCKVLTMRDERYHQGSNCISEITLNPCEEAIYLLLSEVLDDKQNLVALSVGIEYVPLQVQSLSYPNEEIVIHSYGELYDYLLSHQKIYCGSVT